MPADRSQGWFSFGLTCAKKLVREHMAKQIEREGTRPCTVA